MKTITTMSAWALALTLTSVAAAETLQVGPAKKFAKPSQAIAAAKDGDVIEIDTAGKYEEDTAYVRKNNLIIRGVGEGRAVLDSKGTVAGGKGILVTVGNDITVENVEFRGARCDSRNGAGIRAEGKNLTLRRCKFHDCENGILGGHKGEMLIECCEFSYCGLHASPAATHNLYVAPEKLVFRFNHCHHALVGHGLKSRAKENYLLYNYFTDEADGTGSCLVDLCQGGPAHVIGNVFYKGPKSESRAMLTYGPTAKNPEQLHPNSRFYVLNNTFVNDQGKAAYIDIRLTEDDFQCVIKNNIFVGKPPLGNWAKALMGGNFSGGDPLFVAPAKYDFHLKAGSPCVNQGVEPGKIGDLTLGKPEFEYVHPASSRKRPNDGKIDIGAYEFVEAK